MQKYTSNVNLCLLGNRVERGTWSNLQFKFYFETLRDTQVSFHGEQRKKLT